MWCRTLIISYNCLIKLIVSEEVNSSLYLVEWSIFYKVLSVLFIGYYRVKVGK